MSRLNKNLLCFVLGFLLAHTIISLLKVRPDKESEKRLGEALPIQFAKIPEGAISSAPMDGQKISDCLTSHGWGREK